MPNRPHRRPGRTAHRTPIAAEPVSVGEAAQAGWTPSARVHAVARGDLVRPRRGVIARAGNFDPDEPSWERARGALWQAALSASVSSPRAVPSHAAAAVALDLPLVRIPGTPCLTVPAGTALRRLSEAHLHRATLTTDDLVSLGGRQVTSPARTVMDLARERGVDAGVVAADAALRYGLADMRALTTAFEQCRGWPGRKRARIALLLADGRAESPLESLSRLALSSAGIVGPEPQVALYDADGRFMGRADFYWDDYGVVGEADGNLKYDDRDAIVGERRRQQLFEQSGLLVVRWGLRDLRAFDRTAMQLRQAFTRGISPSSPQRRWLAMPTPALHLPPTLTRVDGPS